MSVAPMSVNGWNAEYVDAMHARWSADPTSVGPEWRQFFQGFELGRATADDGEVVSEASSGRVRVAHSRQGRVDSLIYHYRDIGHLAAELDPLGTRRPFPEHLELASFGLDESDLDRRFDPGLLPLTAPATLRDIREVLADTYCRHIGVEYMHIQDRERRRWLQGWMESLSNRPPYTTDEKGVILRNLIEAAGFELFLDKRYKGTKRFGLDGGESLVPMLHEVLELAPLHRVQEYTIGMAHRGRLNVLVNVLHKTYDQIFTEFEEAWVEDFLESGGDVKYHRGYSSDHTTASGDPVRLTLSPNPSHLEFAGSVVLGRARAKQRIRRDTERKRCVPILIHGDASFPGQGIVAECLNMMRLDGYTVGGTLHIVINNQIGFTTNPSDAHSGSYCTDIAKMVDAPIFHVNGDDPEACVFAARMALSYRQEFNNDAVVDLICYRKYGHNEGDEPRFTQPLMYERIANQRPVLEQYVEQLKGEGLLTDDRFRELSEQLTSELDAAQTRSRQKPVAPTVQAFRNVWAGLAEAYTDAPVETGVERSTLESVARALGSTPDGFTPHKAVRRIMTKRRDSMEQDGPLDWAMGEMLAYGTLLLEGHAVRLTGQDVERGTFSHRHAVVFDQKTGTGHDPLNHIAPEQAKFCIHNSPLTESACLGFEYGYSLGDPQMLVIWEAQFGDFANGAQVIFDQFIASAEIKWRRFSGLTVFLPHGYEGQGPEHSSARLERFLTLCADNNMQVVYPTTPAQMFHVLRRQLKRSFRKPLVVMTPKSLLRNPAATSRIADLTDGGFQHVIDDPAAPDPAGVRRLILCSGKVFYDLVQQREQVGSPESAIVRVEQLYPLPDTPLQGILDRYATATEHVWVQEEPENMGAWRYMSDMIHRRFDLDLHFIGRDENASPAVASMKMHLQEQDRIMVSALGLPDTKKSKRRNVETSKQPVAADGDTP